MRNYVDKQADRQRDTLLLVVKSMAITTNPLHHFHLCQVDIAPFMFGKLLPHQGYDNTTTPSHRQPHLAGF